MLLSVVFAPLPLGAPDAGAVGAPGAGDSPPVLPLLPLVLTPSSGPAGTLVSADGVGFGINTTIVLTFNGTSLASTCATDSSGAFPGATATNCTFTVPSQPLGSYSVIASDGPVTLNGPGPMVGDEPNGLAYDSGLGEIFVTNAGSGNVSVVNDTTGRVVANVAVGDHPDAAAYDPATNEVYIARGNDSGPGAVSVISDRTNTVVATIPVGTLPLALSVDSRLGEIFVAYNGSGTTGEVAVISERTHSVVATIAVASSPSALAYDAQTGETFVASDTIPAGTVSVLDDASNTLVGTVDVGAFPEALAVDDVDQELFVANFADGTVSVVSVPSTTVAATISVGGHPDGLAYDRAKAEVLLANWGASLDGATPGNVSVIATSSNSVVQGVSLGTNPASVVYDSGTQDAYLSNLDLNNLSVVFTGIQASAPFSITSQPVPLSRLWFNETGLPANQTWSVTIASSGGTFTRLASIPSIAIALSNGTYSYTIGAVRAYAPQRLGGAVVIRGASVAVAVSFLTGYAVDFTEENSTAAWSLEVNGANLTSSGGGLSVQLPNGTFDFSVSGSAGYVPVSPRGWLDVDGASTTVPVPIFPSSSVFTVTFSESGLPSGTTWSVTVLGLSVPGSNATIAVVLPNGSTPFSVVAPAGHTASPSNGTAIVHGPGTVEAVSFSGGSGSSTALPIWLVVGIGVALAVIVVGIVVLIALRRRAPKP